MVLQNQELVEENKYVTRGKTRTLTGMEINILCQTLNVYNYNELAKKFVIFFWVTVLAKLASTNLEAFTVRACSSAFRIAIPKFIRTSVTPCTCEELGFSKISQRSESSASSWSSSVSKMSARISSSDVGGWVAARSSSKDATSPIAKSLRLSSKRSSCLIKSSHAANVFYHFLRFQKNLLS